MTSPVIARDCDVLTVDDWLSRDDIPERAELFQGVLIVAPPPDADHQMASIGISTALQLVALQSGGLTLYAPTGVKLAGDVGFEPDVLYLDPGSTHFMNRRGVDGPPAICVEVLSPGTRRYDRLTKLPTYLAYGVREVWLVDLVTRTVEVHEPGLAEPRTCRFGEPIPSSIVDVGSAYLDRVPERFDG